MSQGCDCYSWYVVFIWCTQWTGSWAEREGSGHAQNSTTVPQGPPFSSSGDWLLETHNWSQLNTASLTRIHTNPSRLLPHHPHKSSPHFMCRWNNTATLTSLSPPIWPYDSLDHIGVQCLINWHGLTLIWLPDTPQTGFKGHTNLSTRPPIAAAWPMATLHMVPGARPQDKLTSFKGYHTLSKKVSRNLHMEPYNASRQPCE